MQNGNFLIDDCNLVKSNSTDYFNFKTKHRLRFDKGDKSKTGFKTTDHYHVYNPNATSNKDLYLNSNGKPVKHGLKQSHLFPKRGDHI